VDDKPTATGNDFRAALHRAGIIPADDDSSSVGHDLDRALLHGNRAWACHYEYPVDRPERDGDASGISPVHHLADSDG
jgi:hypothetical protein